MDKCSKCGVKRMPQNRYCSNCGHDVSGNTKNLVGKWLSGGGCLFALSPIAMAILSTPIGGNIFSEGGDGGGAALWALLLTLPLGATAFIVGIVLWAANKRK
jgi:hypothetical protein